MIGNKTHPPDVLKNYEDNALAAYKKAIWTDSPDDVIQYAMDAATAIMQARKDWAGIAELHGKFLSEKPDHQMALMSADWVSKAKVRLGKPDEAAQILSDVMARNISDPSKEQVEQLINSIVTSLKPKKRNADPKQLEELARLQAANDEKGVEELTRKMADEAKKQAEELAKLRATDPKGAEEFVRKQSEALATALDEKLTAMLKKAAEGKENPTTNARIYFGRAQMAIVMGDPARAESYLTNIATDDNIKPDDLSPALLVACADILLKKGNIEKAEKMFERLASRYQDSTYSDAGPVGLGQVALARKESQKAFDLFENAITKLSGMSRLTEAMLGKLQALRDLSRYDEAEKLALEIVADRKAKPGTKARAYLILADVFVKRSESQPTTASMETLKKAHAYYQQVYTKFKKEPELAAEGYIGSYRVLEKLGDPLMEETYKVMKADPKVKDTETMKNFSR